MSCEWDVEVAYVSKMFAKGLLEKALSVSRSDVFNDDQTWL